MVSINSLLTLTSFLALQYSQIQAASLGSDPVAVDPNAPQFLYELRGSPIDSKPMEFAVFENGEYVIMNGSTVVSKEHRPQDSQTGLQNSDLQALASVLGTTFSYKAIEINKNWKQGRTEKVAWPGSHWPTYLDGINYVWNPGHPSPAEKYAIVTGKNVQQFMDRVSAYEGIDRYARNPTCKDDSQCGQGNKCGIRAGRSEGRCIVDWAGICHGWAPAAIFEPEPRCAIDYNGVKFQPFDLKALMTQVYADQNAHVGVRYVGALVSGIDHDDRTDEYGRFVKLNRRDIGPAAFHIVTANVMGRDRKNFLFDQNAGAPVWNYPVLSYKFNDPWVMEPDRAAQLFFGTDSYSVFNPNAKKIHYVVTSFKYVNGAFDDGSLVPNVDAKYSYTRYYQYLLELDVNDNIIGGEWVGGSKTDHPDIIWVALNQPKPKFVSGLEISYELVRNLNYQSSIANC